MSLQFILGGSGSGKTTYLYDKIIRSSVEHPRQQYFVIVPEQFTMQAQKDIVAMHPKHATMNIDIVSFERLAYRIFEELAVENLKVLDDMGKSMVLRKVAAQKRRELILFRGHLGQTGFVNQLKSMLSEFYQYGIGPEELREMAAAAKTPLFKQKLEDFALVYEGFREYIAGHYITTEEVLDVLCRVLPGSELIKNSIIALDGYTGFTPVQYRLAELFMVYARQVAVTVTAEDGESVYRVQGMQNLFFMSHQMVRRLSELAEKNGVRKERDVVLSGKEAPRFLKGGQLAYLERSLFRYGQGRFCKDNTGELEIFSAQSPSAEISHVIYRMRRLMREQNLRWRDMAVIAGDLPGYGKEIAHQFEINGIPYFMDDKKNLLENPMAELVRAALEVVQRDFSYESVFRFLRCGLVSGEREMTDRLENYVIALGIRGGKRWRQTWERTYRGCGGLNLVELNAYKDQVMKPVFAMQDSFREENITIDGMVRAVRELLERCGAREKMNAWQQYFSGIKEYRLAREYSQVYELVDDLLTRLSELLGEEKAGRREFMEILDAGFGELKVGAIPATVDRVVVGDITRTRLAGVKALFFVGVNDGIVPSRGDRGSLLSDRERELFAQHQLELAPTAREDSFRQRFYLYLMMTKPSRKLILSFAVVGGDGKSRRPSFLIGEVRKLFPELSVQEIGDGENAQAYSLEDARSRLAAGLGQFRDGELASGGQDSQTPETVSGGQDSQTPETVSGGQDGQTPETASGEPDSQTPETALSGGGAAGDAWSMEQFLELYRWFLSDEERRKEAFRLVEAAFHVYEGRGIGHAAARALYGTVLSGSVTRLEQYAACAYGHFLKYGLELLERQRYQLQAADMGNLFHDSIDLCFSRVKEQGLDWKTISDEDRDKLVHSCVAQVTEEYGNQILGSSSRNAYLAKRMEQITKRTVWALQQQIIKGDFEPAGFEVSFSAADNLKAMKISLSEDEALYLRGRVDRMDLCGDGEQVYVKIIDYKSGGTSFDLLALYYGLQLQLVVYMDAAMELTGRRYPGKEIVPAGILYYNIGDPMIQKGEALDQESIDQEILRKLRMNGLVNSELEAIRHLDHTIEKKSDIIPVALKGDAVQEERSSVANRQRFADLSRFVQDKLKTAGREILHGRIKAEPYKNGQKTACDYCPYHPVCGFDKKTSGYEFRRWQNKKTEEIWEEICQNQQSTGQKNSGR